jgi:acetyltransferase-like isoleucine patch superfamily enzyme
MGSSHWYQENSSRKGKYTYLRLGEGSTITFKGAGRISEGDSIVLAAGVNLEIGENFYINMDTRINAYEDMKIGRNLRCSWECQIFDTDFHAVYNAATNSIQRISRKVVIGDNVWLANRVSVGKGAYIPSSSIVGAHSYINKDYSDIKTKGNLFVGTPAKLIATDRYRFLDSEFDEYIKIYFRNNPDKTTFDVSQLPDFDLNKLLNVKTFGKIESI